jgi:hypothetical protein
MTEPKITPPPELVQQWEATAYDACPVPYTHHIARCAAQWGADQELEACCVEVSFWGSKGMAEKIRTARRPKPPNLKEQALAVLESVAVHELYGNATADNRLSADDMRTIRRALEQLDD